jgi:uncharacterized protein YndB with AHSA1/START domain
METLVVSAIIQRPVEEVFAFLTDARNNTKWQAGGGLQRIQQAPESPVGVGTRILETRSFMGRTFETTSEVTDFEPNRTYTRSAIDPNSIIRQGVITFAPVDGATQVTFEMQVKAGGLFAIAEPLLVGAMKKDFESDLSQLKALLERAA